METLLPCPFCGSTDVEFHVWIMCVRCSTCGAQGGAIYGRTDLPGNPVEWNKAAREKAFEAWNKRYHE